MNGNKESEKNLNNDVMEQKPTPGNDKKFEGGFFMISSPARPTPTSERRSSRRLAEDAKGL